MNAARLLIVEDETVIAMDLKANLQKMGYEVCGMTTTGEALLKIAATLKPDLVLMDIHLVGEMDGIMAAAQLKHVSPAPVVYLTAYCDATTLERAKQTDPYGYILKPFKPEQLQVVIETSLNRAQNDTRILDGYAETTSRLCQTHKLASQALYQSFHDPTTGLPNEMYLLGKLEQLMNKHAANSQRSNPQPANSYESNSHVSNSYGSNSQLRDSQPISEQQPGVLLLSIDRFHEISRGLAAHNRERWLRLLAQRLKLMTAPQICVARLNPDQFALIIEAVPVADVDSYLAHLQEFVQQPIQIGDQVVHFTLSAGLVLLLQQHRRPDDLLHDANLALAQARAVGPGQWVACAPDLYQQAVQRYTIEKDLHVALTRGEIQVFYQPIVLLSNQQVVGFEALVRWEHPELGLLSPGIFLPLAEETGLIVPLGWQVLESAAQQLAAWLKRFPDRHYWVAVNLSWQQLLHPELIDHVQRALEQAQLPPECLHIELLEDTLNSHLEQSLAALNGLAALGVHLAIDDFGTGYSSLSRLNQLPVQTLKVDRSFIRHLGDPKSDAMAYAIVNLAHNLNLNVVAEGIETQEHLEFLWLTSCDCGQGYLFSQALPAQHVESEILDSDQALVIPTSYALALESA